MSNIEIGTITVEAGELQKSYETASWYTTFEYPAQTVPLTIDNRNYWAFYKLDGRDTFENFPSSFGGHQTGGGRIGEIDRVSTYTRQTYTYSIAQAIWNGGVGITLHSGWKVTSKEVAHPVMCLGYKRGGNESCGHEYHVDGMGKRQDGVRRSGNLEAGYIPGEEKIATHYKIIEA